MTATTDFQRSRITNDAHPWPAALDHTSHGAICDATPEDASLRWDILLQRQDENDAQSGLALETTLASSHIDPETHCHGAAGSTTSPRTDFAPTPEQAASGGTNSCGDDHLMADTHGAIVVPATLFSPTLSTAAAALDDLESVRKASENRYRQLTRTEVDADGVVRGFGLDESDKAVADQGALVLVIRDAEKQAVKALEREMKHHPLGPWVLSQKGVGLKQAARLLAIVGDPYVNMTSSHTRTVSQLWAWCGLHVLPSGQNKSDTHCSRAGGDSISAGGDTSHAARDTQVVPAGVAARRRKGVQANWRTDAKTRAWTVVESCMKQLDKQCKTDTGIADHKLGCGCSPYRVIVDKRRIHTAITHPEWTPAHSLADAMRIASKALLRDLWREARRIHEEQENAA